jgi:hypothetical protein
MRASRQPSENVQARETIRSGLIKLVRVWPKLNALAGRVRGLLEA